MDEMLHLKIKDVPAQHRNQHEGYECYNRDLVPLGSAEQCTVSVYEVPPGKSAVPYHYHSKNEEAFYILSGSGSLKTPDGYKDVSAGDFLFFPANEKGAHKLTNTSENEMLIYLDFDTYNDLEVAVYPDSNKIGIWGRGVRKIFKADQDVDYFKDE